MIFNAKQFKTNVHDDNCTKFTLLVHAAASEVFTFFLQHLPATATAKGNTGQWKNLARSNASSTLQQNSEPSFSLWIVTCSLPASQLDPNLICHTRAIH